MKLTITKIQTFTIYLFLICSLSTIAQERIAILQEPFVILLDPDTGAITDPSFIDLTPLNQGTPKGILQVGDEIWITDQLNDRIDRFDIDGNYLNTIGGQVAGGGLDNIKGLEVVESEVWVTNAGTNNGAPGDAIVRYDFNGSNLGFFATSGSDSTFDVIDAGGEVYLSYIGAESKIERRDYTGAVLGNVVEEGVVNFIQQIEVNSVNNSVYAAVFSGASGLYEFAISDGSILNYWSQSSLRGVAALGDGNVLISGSGGFSILDPTTGNISLVAAGSSQFFGRISLPCTPPPAPTGDATQTFNEGATLADMVVSPSNVTWFATVLDASNNTNPLPLSTILVDNMTYYAVNIVDNCLSDPLAVTVNIVLGTNEFNSETITVYPNPANQEVTISNSSEIQRVVIFTLLGQKMMAVEANSDNITLDISNLSAGVYLVTLYFEDSKQIVRLIKSE